ncbi:hypothetical protein EsDP_00001758 [Epichloe bromicola]|uniref:DUF1742-domain-containing protein n=1 Tax=Epichloe bromicola TaxID=79588 RepID=A0ABQ0CIT7_9HYPO
MSAPFPNLYIHRKVAETAAKACDVCYKPSSSVLITADKKDFFYVCPAHLKDTYFCTPKIDEEAIKAKREKALAEKTEKLKKEYEEKQRKKKEKESKKNNDDKDKDKTKEEVKGKGNNADEKDVIEKSESPSAGEGPAAPNEETRLFELKSAFYRQRVQRKRQNEAAKRDRERVARPGYFPSVPSGPPTK